MISVEQANKSITMHLEDLNRLGKSRALKYWKIILILKIKR